MRIAIVTQEEPFYLPPALDMLCRSYSATKSKTGSKTSNKPLASSDDQNHTEQGERDTIVAMIVLPAFDEPLTATASRLFEFYGPVDFTRLGFRFLGAKVADKVNRLAPITRAFSAVDVARRYAIPLYEPDKINGPQFLETMGEEIRPDLLISIAASQVLKKAVLDLPPLGCINLHSAPLPRYQGMMPNFWTMVHQEPEGIVTIHYMVEKLDAGDIILQKPVPINPDDSLHDLMVRSKIVGVDALNEAIQQIGNGTAQGQPMDASQATYFSFPKRADAKRLRAQGRRLL